MTENTYTSQMFSGLKTILGMLFIIICDFILIYISPKAIDLRRLKPNNITISLDLWSFIINLNVFELLNQSI